MQIAAPAAPSGVAAPTSSFELPEAVGAWAWPVQEANQPPGATHDDVPRRHLVVGSGGDLYGVSSLRTKRHNVDTVRESEHAGDGDYLMGEMGVFWGVNAPPRGVLPSINDGLVSI